MDNLQRMIGIGLIVAVLLNGAGFFLKRVGLMDRKAYHTYMTDFCQPGNESAWIGKRCGEWRRSLADPNRLERYDRRHLYSGAGPEILLKLVKYLFLIAFVIFALVKARTEHFNVSTFNVPWPLLPLTCAIAISIATTDFEFGIGLIAAGLRAFSFLAVALVASWFATETRLNDLATWVAMLLALQLLLVAIEVAYGIPLEKGYRISADLTWPSRMAGSFVMPNSLGVFAVIGLAFYYSFSIRRRHFCWLVVTVFALLLLSRSGTGFIGLFVLLALDGLVRTRLRYRWFALVGVAGLCFILSLPALLDRADILHSLSARVDTFSRLFSSAGSWEILFGRGIGVGTNTWNSLVITWLQQNPGMDMSAFIDSFIVSDSTLVMLFAQTGLFGVIAFYGLVGWGMWKDGAAAMFYLMVLLASLTLNVTELFPVGFLLGVVLSRALADVPARQRRA